MLNPNTNVTPTTPTVTPAVTTPSKPTRRTSAQVAKGKLATAQAAVNKANTALAALQPTTTAATATASKGKATPRPRANANKQGFSGNRAILCKLCARPQGATMPQITAVTKGATCFNTITALYVAGYGMHYALAGKQTKVKTWYLHATPKGGKRPGKTFANVPKGKAQNC